MALINMNYFSTSLSRNVNFSVMLPIDNNLSKAKEPFKTLYFLPGYSANAIEICNSIRLMEQSIYKGIAIVIPDGENSFYVNQPEKNAYYSTYVAQELVEVTRKLFPLSKNREDTFIGGISMGGYGSLMLGVKYKDTFSKIIALSPPTNIYELSNADGFSTDFFDSIFKSKQNYQDYYDPATLFINEKQYNDNILELFLCCGKQDELVYSQVADFVHKLTENQIPVNYIEQDGLHDIVFWNKMIDTSIEFLI